MALVKCRECSKEISDQAPACPGCGAPMNIAVGTQASWSPPTQAPPPTPVGKPPSAPPKKTSGCLLVFVAFLLLLVMSAAIRSCSEDIAPPASPPPAAAPVPPSPEAVAQSIAALAAEMDAQTNPAQQRLTAAQRLINTYADSPEAARARGMVEALQAQVVQENLGKQWMYAESEDPMSSKTSRTASVISANRFEFGFPYGGPQNARLTLRRHPRWGNDVVLVIERGQILCSSYECPVRIRFDDDPPKTFTGTEPADNSSETVFIPGFNAFEARLKKAKKLLVEVNIFQQGTLQAEFDVEGFKAERLRETAK